MASATPPPTSSSLWRSRVPCSAERQGLFSRIAPVYDKLNDVLSLGQHLIWKRMSVSWAGAKRRDRVLDLCCGSGDLAFLLSQKVGPDGQVCALDFSKDQLLIATARQDLYWKACYKNIKWIEGDALDLPFADSCFDAMTVGYGLRNLLDKQRAMKEIFRVLKPGSRVSILDFNKSTSSLITQSQVRNCHDTRTSGGTTNDFKEMMQELTRQNTWEITSQGFDLECPPNVGGVQGLRYTLVCTKMTSLNWKSYFHSQLMPEV
uniref:2-phytyl-1,4-beta-naphthoquinone methyltransferase, chloroplastic isoform X1 n=1 Tax=Elaeis guineensis var. tenera TaxID=51953 RepID=A0A8N4EUL3_ELAGV|nr:2-phytyl-1,4-beta-naphthoquinone methyltransferase, chloroplastic isoform X1 [Elaeis guineensis]